MDRKGNILYKFIEECNNSWPKVDEIIDEVRIFAVNDLFDFR